MISARSLGFLAAGVAALLAGCSSSSGSTLGVTEAAEKFGAVAGLCEDPDVEYINAGEEVQFTEDGSSYTRPSYSKISCPSGSDINMTFVWVMDSAEEKTLDTQMGCLERARQVPEKVDEDLSDSEFDEERISGANWRGVALDSSPEELASALGGQVLSLREICEPFVEEMLIVAANPLAPEPNPELARVSLLTAGVGFENYDNETLDTVLDLYCGFLGSDTEEEIIEKSTTGSDALMSVEQTEAIFEALRFGDYTCPPPAAEREQEALKEEKISPELEAALDPTTSSSELLDLAGSEDPEVLCAVIDNPNSNDRVKRKVGTGCLSASDAASTSDDSWRTYETALAIAQNPNSNEEELIAVIANGHENVLCGVARNPNASPAVIDQLLAQVDVLVYNGGAEFNDPEEGVLVCIAKSDATPSDLLDKIIVGTDSDRVRDAALVTLRERGE